MQPVCAVKPGGRRGRQKDMTTSKFDMAKFDMASRKRRITWVTHSVWLVCFPIFGAIGVLARERLLSHGVPLLEWSDARALFIPFALLHLVPVLIVQFLIRKAVLMAFDGKASGFWGYLVRVIDPSVDAREPDDFPHLLSATIGACLGLLFMVSRSLYAGAMSIGPGGFTEVVLMSLAMFPLTIGYLLLLGFLAAAIGAFIGGWVYTLRKRLLAA